MKHSTLLAMAGGITAIGLIGIGPLPAIAAPNITINDVTVTEGGTANFVVSIDARPASGQSISLQARTRNGTALASQDYSSKSSRFSFTRSNCTTAPCKRTFSVSTVNNAVFEATEAFFVDLTLRSAPVTGTIVKPTGTGTILDNDPAPNQPPTCSIAQPSGNVGIVAGQSVMFAAAASDPNGDSLTYTWSFAGGNPSTSNVAPPGTVTVTYTNGGSYAATLSVNDGHGGTCQANRNVNVRGIPNVSINSTSSDSLAPVSSSVGQPDRVTNTGFSLLAINDLGMHCTDLDARVSNILPPFQVLLSQFIQKVGSTGKPVVNPDGYSFAYSAVANPTDPFLGRTDVFNGIKSDGSTFKGNFKQAVDAGSYDAFYPGIEPFSGGSVPKLSAWPTPTPPPLRQDLGLPVPNIEKLYIGRDGLVKSGDEFIVGPGETLADALPQHAMPGILDPYSRNDAQPMKEHYGSKPFFLDFPFGYVAAGVNWNEAAGIPMAPFDDAGRQNPYPMVRVQAKIGNTVTATVDTVLPVSAEASCANCHGAFDPNDPRSRTSIPTKTLNDSGLPVFLSSQDDQSLPDEVNREWAADVNILRLHDLKHGLSYVDATGVSAACDIIKNKPDGNATCLTNRALNQKQSIVCQTCHYTPALDLAQLGPLSGPAGSFANGRSQASHQSNSRVMHNFHSRFGNLFTEIPKAIQNPDGTIQNATARSEALQNNCYQCHPGKETNCLRGAMFNGGILCSDCHGGLAQVGNDFSQKVTAKDSLIHKTVIDPATNAVKLDYYANANFMLGEDFYTNPATPRVPWANEPGCGSCHTGDATSNLILSTPSNLISNLMVNVADSAGRTDGIRLRMAFRNGDAKATPIVPTNKRFAEPAVPVSFNGFSNPGAGNPQLYRLSTGHGGVMCEGCHGPTHAEWPVKNAAANDNVTAIQLQGHAGAIIECSTCHTTSSLSSSTQSGPHGMHLVNDSRWIGAHENVAKTQNGLSNGGTCAACHGANHEGTVLSRAAANRTFSVEGRTVSILAGTPVSCGTCHSLGDSFER